MNLLGSWSSSVKGILSKLGREESTGRIGRSGLLNLHLLQDESRRGDKTQWSPQNSVGLRMMAGGGLPWWHSGRGAACQCRRHGFDPWVRKIPWGRAWQPTPVFLPGESHGQRSLGGLPSMGIPKESDTTERLNNVDERVMELFALLMSRGLLMVTDLPDLRATVDCG